MRGGASPHPSCAYKEGEGKKASESFFSGNRFARLVKYFDALKARDSFKATCGAVRIPFFITNSRIPISLLSPIL
jgi:hypothetical protein